MTPRPRRRLGFFDIPLAAALLAAFFYAPSLLSSPPSAVSGIAVTASGAESFEPLSPPRRLSLHGPLGETVVEIGPLGARVAASPCPGQVCVRAGLLSKPGQLAACVPNRIALRFTGGEGEVDAVSR